MKWTGPGLWSFLKTSKERRKKCLVIWQLIPSPQSPALKRQFRVQTYWHWEIHTITLYCMHTYILFSICKVLCIASFQWSTRLSTRLYTTSVSFHPVVFSAKMFDKKSYRFSDLQLSPTIHVAMFESTHWSCPALSQKSKQGRGTWWCHGLELQWGWAVGSGQDQALMRINDIAWLYITERQPANQARTARLGARLSHTRVW